MATDGPRSPQLEALSGELRGEPVTCHRAGQARRDAALDRIAARDTACALRAAEGLARIAERNRTDAAVYDESASTPGFRLTRQALCPR